MDDEEYAETKKETLEQLDEFGKSLERMKAGNVTLIDNLNAMQLVMTSIIPKENCDTTTCISGDTSCNKSSIQDT